MKEKWSPNHLEEPYKNDLNLILNEQGNQPFESMRKVSRVSSFLVCLLATSCVLFPPCIGGDSLAPGRPLADDGDDPSLTSAAGTFKLGFFSPVVGSNSRYVGIWYPNISEQTVVWVANRQRPLAGRSGSLSITSDGRLVITDENSSAIVWSSGSLAAPLANPVAQLLDDGNLVVRDADDPDRFAWQSFDFPADTLLPGMKMGWNLTSRLNRNLTAWRSASDPAAGEYTAGIDLQGDPQVFLWKGAKKYTRGGSWNGLRLSGVPETVNAYDMFDFQFVIDSQEVAYSYTLRDPAIITRLVINQSGVLQRFVWIKERNLWNLFWFRPKDQCDGLSPCGPNGVCSPNDWPMCHCLQGFRPKNPNNWDLRDSSDGCLRKTELDCLNGTDGFVTLSNAKLPDTSSSVVDWSISLDQCKVLCSTNCSCTAYATANISGSGSGCIMWTTDLTDLVVFPSGSAQDLYVKLAAADLELASTDSRPSHVVVVAVVVPLAIILLAFIVYCIWKRKKTSLLGTSSFTDRYIDHGTEAKDLDLPLFDLCTIAEATSDFSRDNKLGEGGFGPVYKGNFGEEQRIAVKRLSKTSMQGVDEFKNEVTLIAKLQHRNLVRLLGCCIQGDERMLVYEYMPNGSLDAILFDKNKAALLDWQARHNIIIGVARGLLYLHQDSRFRIIHRDLKASNILLDEDMNPKISDFGMARIFGGDETESNTRRVVGTYGYMSPEYAMHGIFSTKSDVFSFGVLVLEIVSGKKNRGGCQGSDHLNLLGYIWSLWQEGKGSDIVDQMIEYSLSLGQVLRCINIGLLCVQERPEDRPTMASIVLMLSSNDSELPQPKQPGFVVTGGTAEIDSSTSNQESLSKNNVSVTLLEGR